jgi:4-hydroxy-3-methylbut-2-en-1-yl diphosphate reductase
VVDRLATRYAIREREVEHTVERMTFKLPRGLAA